MPTEIRIDSSRDPRVEAYRDLRDRHLIARRGLFVAEGRLIVQRVIESGQFVVRSLLLGDASRRALDPALAILPARVPVYVCAVEHLADLTGFNLHRGCLALVDRPPVRTVGDVVRDAKTVIVLDSISNADNVGGVFRSAAAFGVGAILLSPGSCDPLYRKAIRTSMGAALMVPFSRVEPWPAGLLYLRQRGFSLVALTLRDASVSLNAYVAGDCPERIAFLIGAEGSGLGAEVEALADSHVRIPIRRQVDSLNVSVAAGIALWSLLGLTPDSER
jgi:tRNA G18 (ribose-2'-O)-methylase SpoU